MENMKVNVVDTQQCSVTLNIEVPNLEVRQELEKVYLDIQKSAQVPGFRAGKAPMDMIKKNFTSTARERVVENLVNRAVFKALKDQGVEPVSYPVIDELKFDFDKPLSFKVKAERHPKVELKDYKGIKIKKEVKPVTDAKVKETLDGLRERNARLEESKSETVTEKNILLIDYDAFDNGTPVPELNAKNQLVDFSAGQLIAGFKEGLIGAKKGDVREIKVKLPGTYPKKELCDKEITFKAKINEVKEKVLPNLDDELAKDFGHASLKELEGKIRESLEHEEKHRQEQEMQKQVLDHLLDANKFQVPEALVQEELEYITQRMERYARQQGMPEAAWKKNLEQYRDKYRSEAERNVKISYILAEIAKAEKIEITEDDLKQELQKLKEMNKGREADVEKYYAENRNTIASHLKEDRIYKVLFDNAKVKEETK